MSATILKTLQKKVNLMEKIANYFAKSDACLFPKSLNVERMISEEEEKISGGESILLFGTLLFNKKKKLTEVPVVCKLTLTAIKDELWFESIIYTKFISYLMFNNHSMHFMQPYGMWECKDVKKMIDSWKSKEKEKINKYYTRVVKDRISPSTVWRFLVMERGSGTVWNDYMRNIKNDIEFKSVIFQVLYTLECMNRLGLRHNDLHNENLWIDTSFSGYLCYEIEETTFKVPITNNFVKIFDFDRAGISLTDLGKSVFDVSENNTLDWLCKTYGQCNDSNTFADTYYFLWNIYHSGYTPKSIKIWISSLFSNPKNIVKTWGFKGIPCNLIDVDVCDGDFTFPEGFMMSTKQILLEQFPEFISLDSCNNPFTLP